MEGFLILGVAWLIFAGFGAWIATQKGRDGGEGFLLGLLFGPLGCLVEAILPTIVPPPPLSPEDRARREAEEQELRNRDRARQERIRAEFAAMAEQDRLDAIARREWIGRVILRFGWVQALPEPLQPIAWGLLVSLPIVIIIAAAFKQVSP